MKKFFYDFWKYDQKETIRLIIWTLISNFTAGIGVLMLIPMLSVLEISDDQSSVWARVISMNGHLSKTAMLMILLGLYVLLVSVKAIITAKLSVWTDKMVASYTRNLRSRLYDAITCSDWEKYRSYKKTDIINLMITEINRISAAGYYLVCIVTFIITAGVNLVIAFYMNVFMTSLVILVGLFAFVFFKKIRAKTREFGKKTKTANERLLEEITNQINGIYEIRSYKIEKKQREIYWKAEEDELNVGISSAKLFAIPPMIMSIGSAVFISLLFITAYFGLGLPISRIVVLVYVFAKIWPCVSSGQNYVQIIQSIMPVYEKLEEVMEDLMKNQHVLLDENEGIIMEDGIEFSNVDFCYQDAPTEKILHDISFKIKKGEIVAFIGKSGVGKSTLIDLILGFLKPTTGEVLIDGILQDTLGLKVSYIPQDPLLINGSVRENIERFHQHITEEEIVNALKNAQIWDVVEKLPNGMDTLIGDRGIRLSGGERQRIVLARALVKFPQLLILDEATSALDFENEGKIRDILISLKGKLTVILVAHRPSTIQSADHIVVLDNGTIIEEGTYEELNSDPQSYLAKME